MKRTVSCPGLWPKWQTASHLWSEACTFVRAYSRVTQVTGACVQSLCVSAEESRLKAKIIVSGLSFSIFSHSASRCLWHFGTMKWTVFVMMPTNSVASLRTDHTANFVHLATHFIFSNLPPHLYSFSGYVFCVGLVHD